MERRLARWIAVQALFLAVCGCAHRSDLQRAATQENYGVEMARMDLWREAMFRFQRAVASAPDDAMAHNNLAVAFEANGDFEKARKEYLEALRLDRNNSYIQKNYSHYVEFLSRGRKRLPGKSASTAPARLPGPAAGASGGVTTLVPPDGPAGQGSQPRPPGPPLTPPSDLPPPGPPPPPPVPPPSSACVSGGAR